MTYVKRSRKFWLLSSCPLYPVFLYMYSYRFFFFLRSVHLCFIFLSINNANLVRSVGYPLFLFLFRYGQGLVPWRVASLKLLVVDEDDDQGQRSQVKRRLGIVFQVYSWVSGHQEPNGKVEQLCLCLCITSAPRMAKLQLSGSEVNFKMLWISNHSLAQSIAIIGSRDLPL